MGSLVMAKPASRIAEYIIRSLEICTPSYQAPMITAKRLVHHQRVGHRKGVAVGCAAWIHLGVLAVQLVLDVAAQVHAAIGENEAAAFLGVAAAGVGVDLFQGFWAEDVHVSLAGL